MSSMTIRWQKVRIENESDLLRRTARGEEIAFRLIFEGYRHAVYSYGMYFLKDATLADDIVQNVFMKTWLNRQKLIGVRSFNAWLFVVTKHCIFDALKAQLKEQTAFNNRGAATLTTETERTILYREYDRLVNEALNHLTPQQKLIYQLNKREGLNPDEIAIKLKISPHTVKTHLGHALRSMRKFIQPHLGSFLLFSIPLLLPS
ncbi:MAG: sigma-70 family RNA polymerase sigma factor [Chitinophagaceae bacterium]|nr:sigma-70 family RNA polymerase sigma factor [Chitinophagaceae bacterium]